MIFAHVDLGSVLPLDSIAEEHGTYADGDPGRFFAEISAASPRKCYFETKARLV
jgi:hypothetical protein